MTITQEELFTSLRAQGLHLSSGIIQCVVIQPCIAFLCRLYKFRNEVERKIFLSRSQLSSKQELAGSSRRSTSNLEMLSKILKFPIHIEESKQHSPLTEHITRVAVTNAKDEEWRAVLRGFDRLTGRTNGEGKSPNGVPVVLYDSRALLTKYCTLIVASDSLAEKDSLSKNLKLLSCLYASLYATRYFFRPMQMHLSSHSQPCSMSRCSQDGVARDSRVRKRARELDPIRQLRIGESMRAVIID